jgi:eukaryotic-like serine/threonine-protein kinase
MTSCAQCGTSYPDTVRLCPKDGTVLESPVPTHERMIGVVLDDKYRLDSFLSSGGMGAVFRATHVMLGKPLAVKLIKGDLVTSPETARRFQREARAATSLNHPSIVAVYDLGQTKDGTLYIAMELVDGHSLKDEIRHHGRIDPARAQRLLRQIASGLALAHRHQIVHRDLKPQNVMLTRDSDGREVAKLLDFGIAKTFDDAQTQLTAAGFALGTPHYMSPEQATGKDVDVRSDIYSLGVVMYEMLIGEVPFTAPSTSGILVKHMTEPATPPSRKRPDISIPAHLETIALRCLEKEPENRFQTADELAAALETGMTAETTRPMAAAVPFDATTVLVATPDAGVPLAPSSPTGPTGVTHTAPAPTAGQTAATAATLARPAASAGQTSPTMPAAAAQAPYVGKPGGSLGLLGVIAAVIIGIAGLGGAIWLFTERGPSTSEQTMASADPAAPAATPATALPPDQQAPGGAAAPVAQGAEAETLSGPSASDDTGPVAANVAGSAPAGAGSTAPTTAGRSNIASAGAPRPSPGTSSAAATPAASVPAAGAAAQPALAQPAAPAPVPTSLPADPSVFVECRGPGEVCGAVRAAFDQTLQRERLAIARTADRADIVLVATVTLVDERRDQQFGQTMAVRTYSMEVLGDAPRMERVVPMPAPRTFSFDQRVGAERANENARAMAIDAVRHIRDFQKR